MMTPVVMVQQVSDAQTLRVVYGFIPDLWTFPE